MTARFYSPLKLPSKAGILSGLGTAALCALVCSAATLSFISQKRQQERMFILQEATTVRVKLESSLNSRINLERGIVAYIEAHPDLTDAEFQEYSSQLIYDDPVIRNLTVLRGTTIKFVYPRTGNEGAIGRDLAQVPEQRQSVLKAIGSHEPILAGPIALVQGGHGIVIRMGIFPRGAAGKDYYWGQASVVLLSDLLFERAGLLDNPKLLFALRGMDGTGKDSTVFFGEQELFADAPELLQIGIPGGSWELAAVPRAGWNLYPALDFLFWILNAALSLGSGFMMFILVRTRATLAVMAYHDQLTGIPNRSLFWDRLSVALAQAERSHGLVCVYMVDLDDFKMINDTHGHAAGDAVLVEATRRIQAALRKSDTLARLGGDEFVIIAEIDDVSGRLAVSEKLQACFSTPFDLGGQLTMPVGASIGSAMFPKDAQDAESLLSQADAAMYRKKHKR